MSAPATTNVAMLSSYTRFVPYAAASAPPTVSRGPRSPPIASIATVILLGARKEHRLSLPNTRLLIHQPLIPGTVYGPASDLEITANELLKTRARINQLLADECGQPLERIEADTQRDYWLTAEEALAYGLVTRIVRTRAELDG